MRRRGKAITHELAEILRRVVRMHIADHYKLLLTDMHWLAGNGWQTVAESPYVLPWWARTPLLLVDPV
jgi:hypothetical protein